MTTRTPLTFSIDPEVLNQMERYCERTGQKRGEVIRQAIYEFLEKGWNHD